MGCTLKESIHSTLEKPLTAFSTREKIRFFSESRKQTILGPTFNGLSFLF